MNYSIKLPPAESMRGGKEDYDLISKYVLSRSFKHPVFEGDWSEDTEKSIDSIYEKGWHKFQGLFNEDLDLLDSIQNKMEKFLDQGGSNCIYHSSSSSLPQNEARNKELFMSVKDPLVNVPEIAKIIFDKKILQIVKCFFKCVPALGTLNLRKSFVNDLPPDQTNLYHCDNNSPLLLKLFFYLNDVDTIEDGPFNYVETSAFNKPQNWRDVHRVPDSFIIQGYGEERVKDLTAKKGDVLAAMTTGYHKGQKVLSKDRSMLTLNFVVAPEDWDTRKQFNISKDAVMLAKDKVNHSNICLLDFLHVV